MTTNVSSGLLDARTLTPATEARLAALEADIDHLRELDGLRAKAYLDTMSLAMDCGPYAGSEANALSDVQAMLAELDIEKAALRLGLFDDYTEQLSQKDEILAELRDVAERDIKEIERLKAELEQLKMEKEGKGKGREKELPDMEHRDRDGDVDLVDDVQKKIERTAISKRPGVERTESFHSLINQHSV